MRWIVLAALAGACIAGDALAQELHADGRFRYELEQPGGPPAPVAPSEN
ncbi:MAG: hypothetical protein H7124_10215 [Phycisphaerales bacterium]|nr:hypothetical protein [Hyphomonadaceae bacterium]